MSLFHFIDEEDIIYDIKEEKKIERDIFEVNDLNDFLIYKKEVNECEKWFKDYENKKSNNPKILMLIGKKGCGKSLLAQLLLKKFNYDKKEFNDEQLTKKQISELFKNAIHYKNLNEYNNNSTKCGFIFDNIETMLETGDNVIFNELISIVKTGAKNDVKMEKSISKSKKSVKNEDLYSIYNPIICTCNYTNDKKMNELKKLCKVIDLGTPCENDLNIIMNKMCNVYNFKINSAIKSEIYEYCEYDIRKIINAIKSILEFKGFNGIIDKNELKTYILIYGKVDLHCQLNEATYKVLNDKISSDDASLLYSFDTLLIPLMVHHNMINYIKNSIIKEDLKEENNFKKQFESYEKSLESLSFYDEIQTCVYKHQERELMPIIASFFSLYVPNLYLQNLELIKDNKFRIEFTNILNKISQLEVNKKMIQNAFFSTHRLIIDENELIYIIEIFLNLLKISRQEDNESDSDIEEDGVVEDNKKKEKKSRESKNKKEIKYDLEESPYKSIINIMNKYNIDVKSLENILKIEKLNIFENKNPKRLNLKVKEELEHFCIAQNINCDEKDPNKVDDDNND